tara:strand:- start:196 stop:2055 length:1860 start_codon:yes stop_codon:yes gene_type:complete
VGTTGAVKINLFTTGINDWILTPQYDLSAGGPYQIEFDFGVFQYTTNNNGSLPKLLGHDDLVEVLISRDNGSSWNILNIYDSSYVTSNGGNHEIITLPNDSGIVQFAIWASEGIQPSNIQDLDVMLDNFEIVIIPCQQPSTLGASNITATSADLSWISGGNETAWDIQYGSSGFLLGNGTIDSVNSNPYSLTGISGSSDYDFYVKAVCATGDSSSWTGPFTFSTSCSPGTFQSISSCNSYSWNGQTLLASGIYEDTLQANNGCDSVITLDLTINNTSINQDTKNSCDSVFIWNGNPLYASGAYIDTLQSVYGCDSVVKLNLTINSNSFSVTNQVICQGDSLKFGSNTYSIAGTYVDTLQSNIGCDSLATLSLIVAEIIVTIDTSQLSLIATISGGTSPYFYIWSNGSSSSTIIPSSNGLYTLTVTDLNGCISNTDTFNVTLVSCPGPNTLGAYNITLNSADLFWTAGGTETAWEIQYGNTGFALGNGTIDSVNLNPYTLTGLSDTTIYDYYIKAICSTGDSSTWVGPFTFSTLNTTDLVNNLKGKLKIYPNPNNGRFIISNSETINEVFITDLQGKNVYSNKNLNVNRLDIEVNNLEKGMYLVNIVTKYGMNIKTVIIH